MLALIIQIQDTEDAYLLQKWIECVIDFAITSRSYKYWGIYVTGDNEIEISRSDLTLLKVR